jgi:hypothetical protein
MADKTLVSVQSWHPFKVVGLVVQLVSIDVTYFGPSVWIWNKRGRDQQIDSFNFLSAVFVDERHVGQ